jgi:hypothetical protein
MSDTELHDALADLADDVDLVDMLPRVNAGLRQRHRRRGALATAASGVVVAGIVAGAVVLAQGSATTARLATPRPRQSPSVSASPPLSLPDRLPRYLPSGARLRTQGRGGGSNFPAAAFHATYAVNHSTINFIIVNDSTLKRCPIAETSAPPPPRAQPCGPDTSWYYTFNTLAVGYSQVINGRTAHVTAPMNGYGLQDIEWREGSYHYVLTGDRLVRPTGPSGVPFEELARMAESVPTDPSVPAAPALPNPPSVSIQPAVLAGLHPLGRQLLAGNGASISYSGGGDGTLEIDIEPPASSQLTSGTPITDSDTDPAKWRREGATLTHLQIDHEPATAWIGGRSGMSGLRCTIDGFTVGFLGHLGSVHAYQTLAAATTVIPHEPAAG